MAELIWHGADHRAGSWMEETKANRGSNHAPFVSHPDKLTGTNLMMLLKVAGMRDEWTSSNGRPMPADTGDNSPALGPLSGHPAPRRLDPPAPAAADK